jgi:hypothetical protein
MSGCTFEEIVAALGFCPSDLLPGRPAQARTWHERQAAEEQAEQRQVEQALEGWAGRAYLSDWLRCGGCIFDLSKVSMITVQMYAPGLNTWITF